MQRSRVKVFLTLVLSHFDMCLPESASSSTAADSITRVHSKIDPVGPK